MGCNDFDNDISFSFRATCFTLRHNRLIESLQLALSNFVQLARNARFKKLKHLRFRLVELKKSKVSLRKEHGRIDLFSFYVLFSHFRTDNVLKGILFLFFHKLFVHMHVK